MSTRSVASITVKTSKNAKLVPTTKSVPIPTTKSRTRSVPAVVVEPASITKSAAKMPAKRSAATQAVAVSGKARNSTTLPKATTSKKETTTPAQSKAKSPVKPVANKSVSALSTTKSLQSKTVGSKTKKTAEPSKAKAPSAAKSPAPARKMKSVAVPKTPKSKSVTKALLPVTSETGVRAKRALVPADFAQQYGEKAARKTRPPKETAAARKARRNAEEREKLRQFMTPDEELLQRLARLRGEVAPNGNGKAPRKTSTVRRSRSWESKCGKCGAAGTYKAAAALCIKCGAITVRVLD